MSDVTSDFLDRLGDAARGVAAAAAAARDYDNKLSGDGEAGGFDPVTAVDRAIEVALREAIIAAFPGDAIRGEEFGASGAAEARREWSLDPIDGTRAFICGLPSWAVLVGVIEDGSPCRGNDRPARRWTNGWSRSAGDARRDGVAVRTSDCRRWRRRGCRPPIPICSRARRRRRSSACAAAALVTRYGLDAMAYARVASGGHRPGRRERAEAPRSRCAGRGGARRGRA